MKGKLVLVNVPIGNLEDITLRAKKILEVESNFFVEDTRSFRSLMSALRIDYSNKFITSYHDHSSDSKILEAKKILSAGKNVCLLSEAGSPIISDPAYPFIVEIIDSNFEIDAVSGISAVTAALELSGLPAIPFHFHGFFPRSKGDIERRLQDVSLLHGTHVFFESPYRIMETLGFVSQKFVSFAISVVREISKPYQSVYRFKGGDFNNIKEMIVEKGEFVVLIYNDSQESVAKSSNEEIVHLVSEYLSGKQGKKDLAKIFAAILNQPSKEIYNTLQK